MIFLRNMKEVEEHNNNPRSSYKKDVNFFADLSPLQFKEAYLGTTKPNAMTVEIIDEVGPSEEVIDWR